MGSLVPPLFKIVRPLQRQTHAHAILTVLLASVYTAYTQLKKGTRQARLGLQDSESADYPGTVILGEDRVKLKNVLLALEGADRLSYKNAT